MKKVYCENLGCWKNTVDAEDILTYLCNNGFQLATTPEEGHLIIINTCGFIKPARIESYEIISYYNEFKKQNPNKTVIVYGCLNSINIDYLISEFKHIDAFYKISSKKEFLKYCINLTIKKPKLRISHPQQIFLTPLHLKFIKISEGCNNNCSYCLIPKIRGCLVSKPFDQLKEEFNNVNNNELIKEVVLLGQDTANYGTDLGMKNGLSKLLKEFLKIISNRDIWIRIMYMHPKHFDYEILKIMKDDSRICRYFDIPLQHTEDRILNAMNRNYDKKYIYNLFAKIRSVFPDIVLRTTVIVGHPEETTRDYENMVKSLEYLQPDYIGVFDYSLEKKSSDYKKYKNIKFNTNNQNKKNKIFLLQNMINQNKNNKIINNNFKVIIDAVDNKYSYGRTSYMATDIDNYVIIENNKLQQGNFYNVKMIDFYESYYLGEIN